MRALPAATATIFVLVTLATITTASAQPAARPAIDSGQVDRAALLTLESTTDPAVDDTSGDLVVTAVDAAGSWAKLGLRKGDIIVTIDGELVTNRPTLLRHAVTLPLKGVAYIEVIRKRKPLLLRRVINGPLVPPSTTDTPSPASSDIDPALAAEIARIAVPKGTNTWEVDVEPILDNPMRFARGARVVPSVKDGKPYGFKLYAVRPHSLFERLGFKNGDTVTHVGGHELTSMDKALEVYTQLRDATGKVEVKIVRRGKPVTHWYIRKTSAAAP
jgi:S1-C subfamily serine protease